MICEKHCLDYGICHNFFYFFISFVDTDDFNARGDRYLCDGCEYLEDSFIFNYDYLEGLYLVHANQEMESSLDL